MAQSKYDQAIAYAEQLGAEHGASAATWAEISEDNARVVLDGIEAGDPEILDQLPTADLSGQWADGFSATDLYNEVSDHAGLGETDDETYWEIRNAACDAYELAFNTAAEHAVAKRCHYYLDA